MPFRKQRFPNHKERVALWRMKTVKYQWFAISSTALKPENVDTGFVGHFVSMVFEPGTRSYAFQTQKDRDRFITKYRPFGARPCGDPANA